MNFNCPVLRSHQGNRRDFVNFWDRLYFGYSEEFYQKNIGQPLTQERILKWFEWKNRSPLSAQKARTIRCCFLPDHARVDRNVDTDGLIEFLRQRGGAVWRIFWLHLQHPRDFPIYDQHVHRAMAFMLDSDDPEIPTANQKKIQIYLKKFRPFFCSFDDFDQRKVDRALWCFGRFLKNYPSVIERKLVV